MEAGEGPTVQGPELGTPPFSLSSGKGCTGGIIINQLAGEWSDERVFTPLKGQSCPVVPAIR